MARTKALANPELAAQRLRMLIDHLEHSLGSRAAAASALGLSTSYVSKIATTDRLSVGSGAVKTAQHTYGLVPSFFTDEDLGPNGIDAYRSRVRLAHEPDYMKMEWLFGPAAVFVETVIKNPNPEYVAAFCVGLLDAPLVRLARKGVEGDIGAGVALAKALLPVLKGNVSQEAREVGEDTIEPFLEEPAG